MWSISSCSVPAFTPKRAMASSGEIRLLAARWTISSIFRAKIYQYKKCLSGAGQLTVLLGC
jgi:hypothetical protein